MAKRSLSFGKLMMITGIAAVFTVALSLAYLSADPGPMPIGEIITTILGVGITVLIAGGLAGLMFMSASSGRDDEVSHGSPHDRS